MIRIRIAIAIFVLLSKNNVLSPGGHFLRILSKSSSGQQPTHSLCWSRRGIWWHLTCSWTFLSKLSILNDWECSIKYLTLNRKNQKWLYIRGLFLYRWNVLFSIKCLYHYLFILQLIFNSSNISFVYFLLLNRSVYSRKAFLFSMSVFWFILLQLRLVR